MSRWITNLLATVTLAITLLSVDPALARDGAAQDGAAQLFATGRRAFDEARYEDALEAFQESHRLLASPNSRLMVARSLRGLGRLVEAREALWAAEHDASQRVAAELRYRDALRAAQAEGAELDALVAGVRLRVDEAESAMGYDVRVGERSIDPALLGGVFWVMPGEAIIAVEAPDGRSAEASLSAQAGEVHSLHVRFPVSAPELASPRAPRSVTSPLYAEPEEPASRVSPFAPIGWIALGLGAASLGAFGAFYAITDDHYGQLTTRCASSACSSADLGDGPTLALLSNLFFVSSLVLLPVAVASLVIAQLDVGSVTLAVGPGSLHARVLF